MDLARIRARGRSRSAMAWVTNPLRALLWRLLLPYHEQIVRELDAGFLQARTEVDAGFLQTGTEVDARFQHVTAEVDAAREMIARTLRDEEVLTRLSSRLSGLHKDQAALGYRLAGMEETLREAAESAAEALRTELEAAQAVSARVASEWRAALDAARAEAVSADEALRAWLKAVQADGANAAGGLQAGIAEVRGELSERLGRQEAEAEAIRRSVDRLADRQAEADDRLRALTERDWPLRAGDKVAVDGEGLTITSGPAGRFLVRTGDLVGGVILSGQVWEPHVRAAIERHAQPGRTAVDVGAYIGLHTVHLSRFFREVLAFEPQEEIYQTLCANLVLNGCRNVRARCEALYDGAPAMRLAPPEGQEIPVPMIAGRVDYRTVSNAAALTFQPAHGSDAGAVPARTLDSLGLEDLGFLKVDTQGADLAVLRGGQITIERCRPVIAFEYERDLGARHGATLEGLEAFFDALGYRLEMLADTNPGLQADYLALPR